MSPDNRPSARPAPVPGPRSAAGSRSILGASDPRSREDRRRRKPLRDQPVLILAGIAALLAVLLAVQFLADRSQALSPNFLSEVVLYGLAAADMTMLLALVFVLARNLIKLVVERRRALLGARFRAKMVLAVVSLSIVPAVLVLLVGSDLIRKSVERWFSAPVDEVLGSAQTIASEYYRDRSGAVERQARQLAEELAPPLAGAGDLAGVRATIESAVTRGGVGMVEVYTPSGGGATPSPLVGTADPAIPLVTYERASADRLAAKALAGQAASGIEPLGDGELVRAAVPVAGPGGRPIGAVVVSNYLRGGIAQRAKAITEAYQAYAQLRVLKRPLTGVYLSFFLMMTLLILVSATWAGLYIAKRITQPIQLLEHATREIAAGHLDHRIEHRSGDELGALVDGFNAMAAALATTQQKLERSRADLEQKNTEVEARRLYMETILEHIATGVISLNGEGRITTINRAAARLLHLGGASVGADHRRVLADPALAPLKELIARAAGDGGPVTRELALELNGREVHLAASVTTLGSGPNAEGVVIVFDDLTPLIRAQKVAAWREVARRLAHEIKNPLTPIQLCAERIRRHTADAPADTVAVVDECTRTIVTEVEGLKALVDEFSQFARLPAPRAIPIDLHALVDESLALYDGLFSEVSLTRHYDARLPVIRADPEQLRRVLINLVDNGIEATERRGHIDISTAYDEAHGLAKLEIADDGPGIPEGERDKLFMPYYSTKQRGSGLGLAIVRRIVAEHHGAIRVSDNRPRGTRFTIELPV